MRRGVFYPFPQGVGDFVRYYLGRSPTVTKEFVADDAVIAQFRKYLDQQHIKFTEPGHSGERRVAEVGDQARGVHYGIWLERRLQGRTAERSAAREGRRSDPAGQSALSQRAQDRRRTPSRAT